MFESCHPFSFFDYFRVPYSVRPTLTAGHHRRIPFPVHQLRVADQSGRPRDRCCGSEGR